MTNAPSGSPSPSTSFVTPLTSASSLVPFPTLLSCTLGHTRLTLLTLPTHPPQNSPPLSKAYDLSGVALPTIKQNWNYIDYLQLMTYDGEPNFDPRVCMALTVKALEGFGASSPKAKLLVGAELGDQFGDCKGVWVLSALPYLNSLIWMQLLLPFPFMWKRAALPHLSSRSFIASVASSVEALISSPFLFSPFVVLVTSVASS